MAKLKIIRMLVILFFFQILFASCGKDESKDSFQEDMSLESRSGKKVGTLMTLNEKRIMKFLSTNKTFNESMKRELAYLEFISKEAGTQEKVEKLKKIKDEINKNPKLKEQDIEKLYAKDFRKEFKKINDMATLGMLAYHKQLKREVEPFLNKYNISEEEYQRTLPKAKVRVYKLFNRAKLKKNGN